MYDDFDPSDLESTDHRPLDWDFPPYFTNPDEHDDDEAYSREQARELYEISREEEREAAEREAAEPGSGEVDQAAIDAFEFGDGMW